jgi:hypothetical protein
LYLIEFIAPIYREFQRKLSQQKQFSVSHFREVGKGLWALYYNWHEVLKKSHRHAHDNLIDNLLRPQNLVEPLENSIIEDPEG